MSLFYNSNYATLTQYFKEEGFIIFITYFSKQIEKMKTISSLVLLALLSVGSSVNGAVPTAIFHGLGDACHHRGMKDFTDRIADGTGAIAKCVEVGLGAPTSIFDNFEDQADQAC